MVCDVLESPGLALVRDGYYCVECFKSTIRGVCLLVLVDEMPALRIAEAGAEAHCRSYECLVAVCRRHQDGERPTASSHVSEPSCDTSMSSSAATVHSQSRIRKREMSHGLFTWALGCFFNLHRRTSSLTWRTGWLTWHGLDFLLRNDSVQS